MNQEHFEWVKQNMLLFTTSRRYTPEQLAKIFEIYNAITGESKKTTTCGRCIETTKKRVLHEYTKQI